MRPARFRACGALEAATGANKQCHCAPHFARPQPQWIFVWLPDLRVEGRNVMW